MKKIEEQIAHRLLKEIPTLTKQEIEPYTPLITKVGYHRIVEIVTLIRQQEQPRVCSIQEIMRIIEIEQEIRVFLTAKISDFELALRSIISEGYFLWYGADGYQTESNFSDNDTHAYLMYKIKKQFKMQPEYEVNVLHISDDVADLTIWEATEISTFQMLTIFYKLLTTNQKEVIAEYFHTSAKIFETWIEFILVVRNACAHQGILLCREFRRNAILPHAYKRTVYAANYVLATVLGEDFSNNITQFFHSNTEKWMMSYYGIPYQK